MSSNPNETHPQTRRPVVVRPQSLSRGPSDVGRMLLLLGCLVLSLALHVVAVVAFLLVPIQESRATAEDLQTAVIETKVEDNTTKPPDLENDELGIDAEVPTNYDNDRIEAMSVPGPNNVDQAVGIKDAPEGIAQTLPPPPGFGNSSGQGGAIESSIAGAGQMVGLVGMGAGGKFMPGGFGGRSGSTREQMVKEGGGNDASEAAVASGIKWLAVHQAPDGHWSMDGFNQHGKCNCTGFGSSGTDIAGTAFGLLPMLGGGQTHKGTGEKGSLYAKNVERGLTYLMGKQSRDGDFGGGLYSHGLATIAMCEAYGLTSDPRLKSSAQRALNFIAAAQNGKGGWDYGPRGPGTDTSVGGWQLMALKSGLMSGLDVPKRTTDGAMRWLDAVASPDGGGYGYRGPGESATMSAVGLLCRQYLGWGVRNPGLIVGVERLKRTPPESANTMYYSYYATQVMHHMGGEAWTFWNPRMRDLLIARQDKGDAKHPHHKGGDWSPAGDAHGGAGGRIMITSLSLLTLEVYYRHLPLYRRDMGGGK